MWVHGVSLLSFTIGKIFCNVTIATYYIIYFSLFNIVHYATAMFLSRASTISEISPKFCFRLYLFWDLLSFLWKYSKFLWNFW